MTTKQTGGPAYPCKITTDVEALKQQQPRQNHITAEERIEASFINGWNECLDMLASRNLLRQDSVADMMEALPIGFSIYHANNGKWVIVTGKHIKEIGRAHV